MLEKEIVYMPIDSSKHLFVHAMINKKAPDTKGVFALYGPDKGVIYYGRSNKSIREELLSHCNGKEVPCTQQAWYFSFELTNAVKKREKELLEEYQKTHAVLPRCNVRVHRSKIYKESKLYVLKSNADEIQLQR